MNLTIKGKKMARKVGRPLIVVDWEQVDSMCEILCTGEEQAGILGIDYDSLQRACKREKGVNFAEYCKEKSGNGKMSLRRKQYSIAMEGNPTMLIWLGKNWLGQTDKTELAIDAVVDQKQTQPIYEIVGAKPVDDDLEE